MTMIVKKGAAHYFVGYYLTRFEGELHRVNHLILISEKDGPEVPWDLMQQIAEEYPNTHEDEKPVPRGLILSHVVYRGVADLINGIPDLSL